MSYQDKYFSPEQLINLRLKFAALKKSIRGTDKKHLRHKRNHWRQAW